MATVNQPIGKLPYFYDTQLRRILIQFMRVFTVFSYSTGTDSLGNPQLVQVPVVYGEPDLQATQMLMGNSENVTLSIPRISVTITALKPAALERGSYQGLTQTSQVQDRAFDQNAGTYTPKIGNSYQVEALRPNPIDIQFRVDILTSNTDQKFQIFEQIFTLFNPSLDFQTTSSNLDWTGLNIVTLEDITWDYEGPALGTDAGAVADVLALMFTAKCWINPPARVTKQALIHKVIERLGSEIEDCDSKAVFPDGSSIYEIVTPGNYKVSVNGSEITLLDAYGNTLDENGNIFSWIQLTDDFGGINANESKIALRWANNDTQDILGTISLHPTLDNILLFNVINDTLPIPTLVAVQGIIDPHVLSPGNGLPGSAIGQRYILSGAVGGNSEAWGNISPDADINDIIEFDGSNWNVVTDASTDTNLEFIQNEENGILLRLFEKQWVDAINSIYSNGHWSLML